MATLKKLEQVAKNEYTFVLLRDRKYSGKVTILAADKIDIKYVKPPNEAVDAKLREELDPFIIDRIIREVLPHGD